MENVRFSFESRDLQFFDGFFACIFNSNAPFVNFLFITTSIYRTKMLVVYLSFYIVCLCSSVLIPEVTPCGDLVDFAKNAIYAAFLQRTQIGLLHHYFGDLERDSHGLIQDPEVQASLHNFIESEALLLDSYQNVLQSLSESVYRVSEDVSLNDPQKCLYLMSIVKRVMEITSFLIEFDEKYVDPYVTCCVRRSKAFCFQRVLLAHLETKTE